METLSLLVIVIFFIIIVSVIMLIFSYNNSVRLLNEVDKAYAQIDTQYQRRWDLIKQLVKIVEKYSNYEKSTLRDIIEMRSSGKNPVKLNDGDVHFKIVMGKVSAIAEAYPDLKANTLYSDLMEKVNNTEDRLNLARRYFNESINLFNNSIDIFPIFLFANSFGFTRKEHIPVPDKTKEIPDISINIDGIDN